MRINRYIDDYNEQPRIILIQNHGLIVLGKTTQQVEKPRFEFYKILPGAEEPVTEQQMKQAAKTGAPAESFLLQVGAFQNPAEADNLKARLALIGVEANVEPVDQAEKGTWYRVRVAQGGGPGSYVAIGSHHDHVGMGPPVDHDSIRAFNQVVRVRGAVMNLRQVRLIPVR